jgi:adenylosuccinate synthase
MDKRVCVLDDLGHGDCGKGTSVDFFARFFGFRYVVRYGGGPQAAHHVVLIDGRMHCFSQFGSATFIPGVKTLLSRFMYFNPLNLEKEEEVLRKKGITDAYDRILVDRQCPIVTPLQVRINQLLELSRGHQRHGSCGYGVGQTVKDHQRFGDDYLFAQDLSNRQVCAEKIWLIWQTSMDLAENLLEANSANEEMVRLFQELKNYRLDLLADNYEEIVSRINVVSSDEMLALVREEGAIFEPAQGILLDPEVGFFPHTTSTNTTMANAEQLISESGFTGQVTRLGVLRAYAHRHGAGPFPTEDRKLLELIPPCHNNYNEWQEHFRLGWFDLVATRYAIEAAGQLDGLMLTNLDRLSGLSEIKVCQAYRNSVNSRNELSSWCKFNRKGEITGLKQLNNPDIDTKVKRTQAYKNCLPVYDSQADWIVAGKSIDFNLPYLKYLEKELGVPIVGLSAGPTADDKMIIPRFP